MKVADLTVEEFREIVREVVFEVLAEYEYEDEGASLELLDKLRAQLTHGGGRAYIHGGTGAPGTGALSIGGYRLYREQSKRDLSWLDSPTAALILRRVRWAADNVTEIRHVALRGSSPLLFRLRVGDYRVIYELVNETTLKVWSIGHAGMSTDDDRREL